MSTTPEQSKDSAVDTVLLIRLIAASILFAVALVLKLPTFLRIILLAVSAAAAGCDIALKAVEAVQNKDFFATPVIIVFVAFTAFIIRYSMEGAALVILYQFGLLLISYAQEHVSKSALELIRYQDQSIFEHMSDAANDSSSCRTFIASELEHSAGSVLKLAIAFAAVYAIVLPLLTSYNYSVSIHRALVIIAVSSIGSIIASMPSTAAVGMCTSAGQGIIPNNAVSLETLADVEIAVFDKSGVFSESSPRVISAQTTVLDRATFAAFAAHAVYYSEQSFARAVSALYNKDYRLDVISDFVDIPGSGVELSIGGAHVTFAKRELFSERGVSVPVEPFDAGQVYYMTVADRYVGKITVSNETNSASENLVRDCRAEGIEKCVLLTEEGRGESEAFAEEMRFTGLFSQCDTETKLNCISDIKNASSGKVMYVYSTGIQTHSAADVDIRISKKAKFADILVPPEYISNLPLALQISQRMKEISVINALIAFIVKAILIFLAIIGFCNIWIAIIVDNAAAIATIFNSLRVSKESVVSLYKYKSGK